MKILHIITGLNTGGAERALYNVLGGGLNKQFECAVLSLSNEGTMGERIRELGVPVYTLGMSKGIPGPVTVGRLAKIIRSFAPDVIQGWMYHGNLAASFASWLARRNPSVIWNIRQTLYRLGNEKPLTRQIIRANRFLSTHPGTIVYNSHLSRSQHEAYGISAENSVVIPNGFQTNEFDLLKCERTQIRQELSFSEDVVVIGHVARFHPMKDHLSFLRAAASVAKRNDSVRFLLVGNNVSLENSTLSSTIPNELLDRFVFLGERSDAHRIMQALDLLTTSSAWGEAFPNVLGEAMASGIPCVATDVGDSATIVAETGIVVPPSDSMALAQGIVDMLKKTASEREFLGQAARMRIERYYGLDTVISQYAHLYDECLSQEAGNS